jgi:hypothetical protein
VDFAKEGRHLRAFEVGVVDDAEGELHHHADEDDQADGLVRRVEVGVLRWKERVRKGVVGGRP